MKELKINEHTHVCKHCCNNTFTMTTHKINGHNESITEVKCAKCGYQCSGYFHRGLKKNT